MNGFVMVAALLFGVMLLAGCCSGPICELRRDKEEGKGGGRDVVTINLPFPKGYGTQCVQGVGGEYSHIYSSTYHDLDLDTPNNVDDPVFAPVGGMAYVHDGDPETGFGIHVTIDLGDGTYILLGHMKDVFVDDGSEVVAGELIGLEGTTGYSTGDHVHMGRHVGDAEEDATLGTSVDGLRVRVTDKSVNGPLTEILTEDFVCSLGEGHFYVSELETPLAHPAGSLLKTPFSSTVYMVGDDGVEEFPSESAFLSGGFEFTDVALVSEEEMNCYSKLGEMLGPRQVRALRSESGEAWILLGEMSAVDRFRLKLPSVGWQGVLKSYGVRASSFDDIDRGDEAEMLSYRNAGVATYREGALVSPAEASDVYVMVRNMAMPIKNWEVLLLLGWEERRVIEVSEDEMDAVLTERGSCTNGVHCLSREDVTVCGGLSHEEEDHADVPVDEEEGEVSGQDTDSGDSDLPHVDLAALVLTWTAPGGQQSDHISLSGEYLSSLGTSTGWQSGLAEASDAHGVTYEYLGAGSGDSFRFSVEYVMNGVTSWSCLAPFPPGVLQGVATATLDGANVPVTPVDDPGSDGCGLKVTVP